MSTVTDLPSILEAMIDEHGLSPVLAALETVCAEKADHIRFNWQDKELAKQWAKVARAISTVNHNAIDIG